MLSRISTIGLTVSLAATFAPAATIYLRDVDSTPTGSLTSSFYDFNGNIVTNAVFDDAQNSAGSHTNAGSSQSMQLRNLSNGVQNFGVLAIKDLFTAVPKTNGLGQTIEISSAKLHLAGGGNYSAAGRTLTVSRVITDWLANSSGDNETRVSGNRRNGATPGNTVVGDQVWAGGGAFGGSDITATNQVTSAFAPAAYGAFASFTITDMLQDMYDLDTNFGFHLNMNLTSSGGDTALYVIRSSNDTLDAPSGDTFRPVLEIEYTYVPEPAMAGVAAVWAGLLLVRRRK